MRYGMVVVAREADGMTVLGGPGGIHTEIWADRGSLSQAGSWEYETGRRGSASPGYTGPCQSSNKLSWQDLGRQNGYNGPRAGVLE